MKMLLKGGHGLGSCDFSSIFVENNMEK